jgi:sulfur carrier protein
MNIFVNGLAREVHAPMTVASLLDAEGQAGRRVAVELNREIVPRSRHTDQALADGDRVEIIQAIGGG